MLIFNHLFHVFKAPEINFTFGATKSKQNGPNHIEEKVLYITDGD